MRPIRRTPLSSRRRVTPAAILSAWAVLAAPPAAFASPAAPAGLISVEGTVLDPSGAPLEGVEVRLHPEPDRYRAARLRAAGRLWPRPAVRARTGADGRFRIEAPAAGPWTLVARADGRLPVRHPLWPLYEPIELEPVRLPEAEWVRIRVLGPDGGPSEGALVALFGSGPPTTRRWPGQWGPIRMRPAVTGAGGEVGVPRAVDEEVGVLAVGADGLGVVPEAVALPPEGPLVVRLEEVPRRTVEVRTAGGSPAARVVVWCGLPVPSAVTGADGRAEVMLLEGRSCGAQLDAPGGRVGEGIVEAPGDGDPPPPVRLEAAPAPEIGGRVVVAGAAAGGSSPVAGAWVWLSDSPQHPVATDRAGGFRLPVLQHQAGRQVYAVAAGHLAAAAAAPEPGAAGAEELLLRLEPAGSVAGVVVDGAGEPVADAEVRATPGPLGGGPFQRLPRHHAVARFARTGADGRFLLRRLSDRPAYEVTVSALGYSAARLDLPPPARGELSRPELRIVLGSGVRVRGTVIDPYGEPVAGATALLFPSSRDALYGGEPADGPYRAATGADGIFEVADPPAGPATLAVTASGRARRLVGGLTVPANDEVLELGEVVLAPEAAVEGRVVTADGEPVPGAGVVVLPGVGAPIVDPESFRTARTLFPPVSTEEDGRFRLAGLEEGVPVQLHVDAQGFESKQLGGIVPPTGEPLEIELRADGTLAGTVVDRRGRPVAGARISIVREGGRRRQGYGDPTGEDGRFRLASVAPGQLAVEAGADGYTRTEPAVVELEPGQTVEDVRLVLARTVRLEGRVVAPDGLAVAGARVTATWGADPSPAAVYFSADDETADTGADGRFVLDQIPPPDRGESVRLHASADGYGAAEEVVGPQDRGFVELVLAAGVEVSGRVVDAERRGVGGARVRLLRSDGQSPGAVTGADGGFRFDGVTPGEYPIFLELPASQQRIRDAVEVGSTPVRDLVLRVPPGGRVSGRLVGLDRDQLGRVRVRATSEHGAVAAAVDREGSYALEGLFPGRWWVEGEVPGGGPRADGSVDLEAGAAAVLDLSFDRGIELAGRVLWDGEPLVGAHIFVQGGTGRLPARGTTDSSGGFRVSSLSPGRHTLEVRSGQDVARILDRRQVDVESDRYLLVELGSRVISGRVLAAEGPLSGVVVSLEQVGEDLAVPFGGGATALTAGDGEYRVDASTDGRWRLRFHKQGYAAAAVEVEVAGFDARVPDLLLAPERVVELVVRRADGGVPEAVVVEVAGGAGSTGFRRALRPGPDGVLRVDGLAEGTSVLRLASAGSAVVELPVQVPSAERRTVVLPAAAAVSVVVPELVGAGVGAIMRLTDAGGRAHRDWLGRSELPLADGRGAAGQLAPGAWTITVTAADGRTWTAEASLQPGDTPTELVLR